MRVTVNLTGEGTRIEGGCGKLKGIHIRREVLGGLLLTLGFH